MVTAALPTFVLLLAASASPPACGSLEQCVAAKRQELTSRGTVGIGYVHREEQAASGRRAVLPVAVVGDGLPAAHAGIRREDKIVAIKGQPVPVAVAEVDRVFAGIRPGDTLELTLERDGKAKSYRLIAVKPTEQVLRGWLNRYVEENFSTADFDRYLELSGQRPPLPPGRPSPSPH